MAHTSTPEPAIQAAVLLVAALQSEGIRVSWDYDAAEGVLSNVLVDAIGPEEAPEILDAWRNGESLAEMLGCIEPHVETEV